MNNNSHRKAVTNETVALFLDVLNSEFCAAQWLDRVLIPLWTVPNTRPGVCRAASATNLSDLRPTR